MNLSRKPYKMKGLHDPVDFKALRFELIELLRQKPMTSQELIAALKPRFSGESVYRGLKYAREDNMIHREKHNKPWQIKK